MIRYHLIQKVNPRDLASPKKFYAMPQQNSNIGFRELVKSISKLSTVNPPDIVYYFRALPVDIVA